MDLPNFENRVSRHSPGKLKLGTRKALQQHHLLLIHAHKCQQREAQPRGAGEPWKCHVASCKKFKKVVNHMMSCAIEDKCRCSSSRQMMKTYSNCRLDDCPVCVQRKRWQMSVTPAQRSHAVQLLAQVCKPASLCYGREMSHENILVLNKIIENDIYNMANTLPEYYGMLATKKWDIEMRIETRRIRAPRIENRQIIIHIRNRIAEW